MALSATLNITRNDRMQRKPCALHLSWKFSSGFIRKVQPFEFEMFLVISKTVVESHCFDQTITFELGIYDSITDAINFFPTF